VVGGLQAPALSFSILPQVNNPPAAAAACAALLTTHGPALEAHLLNNDSNAQDIPRILCVDLARLCTGREATGGGDEL
jgi:hypothetical protein